MKAIGVDEPFSSICINHGSLVKVHKDSRNKYESVNATIGLGDDQDGGFWVHEEGTVENGVRKKLPDGSFGSGQIFDTRNKLVKFDLKVYHSVEEWGGDPWSIAAYTNRACHKLSSEELGILGQIAKRANISSS